MTNQPVKYDCPSSCNKCGGDNIVHGDPFNTESSGECSTECKKCGFKDYWAHGFYESNENGFNASRKYSFGNTK